VRLGGEAGWAWVVPGEGATPSDADQLRHCREHLAGFRVPRRVKFLDADDLPKTSTGQVQKYLLVQER
jgi:fatty-acyl-CoA synthase